MSQSFVLDNSVAMRWCFEDTTNAYAEAILEQLEKGDAAFVPVLWRYEVVAVLAKAQKHKSLTADQAADFLESLTSFSLPVDYTGVEKILQDVHGIAVQYGLTGYDAAYLELALRKNLPLATLDEALQKAALQAGVELFDPSMKGTA